MTRELDTIMQHLEEDQRWFDVPYSRKASILGDEDRRAVEYWCCPSCGRLAGPCDQPPQAHLCRIPSSTFERSIADRCKLLEMLENKSG